MALAMVVVILTAAMSNYALKTQVIEPFREAVSQTAALTADDELAEHSRNDFKPPKHSFVDYDSLFNRITTLLAYAPCIFPLVPHSDFQAPPEVYPEIIVPPQNLA